MPYSNHTEVLTVLHKSLSSSEFKMALDILSEIQAKAELDEIMSKFLQTYRYNFRTRFYEKADFASCLQFSNILNKRFDM